MAQLEKNPVTISQFVDLDEYKKIKSAINTNSFEKYVQSVRPIIIKKKNSKGKIQAIQLEPDFVTLENIGAGIAQFHQLENIQGVYLDLYEATPERERYQFLLPEKFNLLDVKKALVELKHITSSQEKFQARNDVSFLPNTNSVPTPNCTTEIGFSSQNGDDANWCSSTDFHPQSLLKFSRMAMNSDLTCVKDQGHRGTCVSFAINAAIESRKISQGANQGRFNFAEQFTYSFGEIKSGWGKYNYGLSIAGALEDIKNEDQKIPLENQWRYNPSYSMAEEINSSNQYPRSCNGYNGPMCTNFAFQAQERDLGWWQYEYTFPTISYTNSARIRSFNTISTFWSMTDALDSVISIVNDRKPVIVGFTVRTNFMDTFNHGRVQTETFKAIQSNESLGGHAAVLVGFVRNSALPEGVPRADEKGYFIMKNSWGTGFGDCGFYYVDYKYMKSYAQGFYTIRVR